MLDNEFSHTIFHKQQLITKDGEINKLEAAGDGKSRLAIEPKKQDDRRAQPVKTFEPQIEKPRAPAEPARRPASSNQQRSANNFYKPKPAGGAYQVGYSNPNMVGQRPKPKYSPNVISAEEQQKREEREREREEIRRQREERERKIKEDQKKIEKQRLEQWRKEYEENQKVDLERRRQEESEKRKEEERLRMQNLRDLEKRNEVEKIQRSNVYYQARYEAEMNKRKHQEAERKAADNIFGYVEPEPVAKQRPSTAAQAKKDVAGDLNNNQLNKQNYHFANKAYNYNPTPQKPVEFLAKHPDSQVPKSYYNERPGTDRPSPAKPEAPAYSKPEPPTYSRPEVPAYSKPEPAYSYQDPPNYPSKPPSTKVPSFEEFFPPAKPVDKIRKPPSAPAKPKFKPSPVQNNQVEVAYQPKKQLQNVYPNMLPPEPEPKKPLYKPSIAEGQAKKSPDFDTMPFHLKNTNQKINALDEVNKLIQGVTDLSYLDDNNAQSSFKDSDDYEVYG